MANPLSLTISGNAILYRRAERAVVTIRVHSEGPSQQTVSKEVTDRSNELRAILKQYALKDENGTPPSNHPSSSLITILGDPAPDAAITHWTMKTLQTNSNVRVVPDGKKLPREYKASTSFIVRLCSFTELGTFASMLATMENVSVQEVSWELTDATKAGLGTKSRIEAIKNANEQARDYCKALGRGEVTAREVIGGHSGIGQAQYYGGHGHGGYRGGGGGAGGEDLNFEPENVSFSCNVTVKYQAA